MSDSNVGGLALGIVGAVVGAYIGGPTGAYWGWAIGSGVGAAVFAPDGPNIHGPRLHDTAIQHATYGTAIPAVYGTMRTAGAVIWSTGLIETKHKERHGKGGGGGSTTTYTYSTSFALALSRREIVGIRRIWADGKLILDNSETAPAEVISANPVVEAGGWLGESIAGALNSRPHEYGRIRVYRGTEDQEPDPLIEAYEGVGNVPAYRGLAYLVWEDLQLADFGNRLPNITVEVVADGTVETVRVLSVDDIGMSWFRAHDQVLIDEGVVTFSYPGPPKPAADSRILSGGGSYNTAIESGPPRRYRVSSGAVIAEEPTDYGIWPNWTLCAAWELGMLGRSPIALIDAISAYTNYPGGQKATPAIVANVNEYGLNTREIVNSLGGREISGVAPSAEGDRLFVWLTVDGVRHMRVYNDQFELIADIESPPVYLSNSLPSHNAPSQNACAYVENGFLWSNTGTTIRLYRIGSDYSITLLASTSFSSPGLGPARWCYADNGVFVVVSQDGRVVMAARGPFITPTPAALPDVVRAICRESGLTDDDLDLSALSGEVDGYVVSNVMSARAALEPLQRAHWFDLVESDWIIRAVPRGGAPVRTLVEDELGAVESGQPADEPVTITRAQELELPRRVLVQYADPAQDYQQSQQYSGRIVTAATEVRAVSLPMVLSNDRARQIADVLLADAWTSRNSYQLSTWVRHIDLDPADVIRIELSDATHTLRIGSIDASPPALVRINAVAENAAVYHSDAPGAGGGAPHQSIAAPGPTQLLLLDTPLLLDEDDGLGLYLAANGYLGGWRGCVVYRSLDAEVTWEQVAALIEGATIGTCLTALPSGPVTIWDRASTVTVRIPRGELSSTTEDAVLNGANAALIGAHGRWEVVQFANATLNADGTYTLSTMLRGRRGTEWAVGTHQVHDAFVLLERGPIERMPLSYDAIGAERHYRGVTMGRSLLDAPTQALTAAGVSLKPYSPVHIRGSRDGSGNLTISWIRRTRIGGAWLNGSDVPLGEESAAYEVDIMSGNAVKRTLSSTTQSVVYTAAQQVADFGAAQSSVSVRVYQLSATIGRGYPGAATV